jgi:hypothetical protein
MHTSFGILNIAICKEQDSTAVISVHEKYLNGYGPKQDLQVYQHLGNDESMILRPCP